MGVGWGGQKVDNTTETRNEQLNFFGICAKMQEDAVGCSTAAR